MDNRRVKKKKFFDWKFFNRIVSARKSNAFVRIGKKKASRRQERKWKKKKKNTYREIEKQ